ARILEGKAATLGRGREGVRDDPLGPPGSSLALRSFFSRRAKKRCQAGAWRSQGARFVVVRAIRYLARARLARAELGAHARQAPGPAVHLDRWQALGERDLAESRAQPEG